ncbi:hypothetical protein ACIQUQ_30330 [Streptomyces sp. NPDC101118]|uniref:hypothetical protein n=1 Tax=Streptomyces sp. NPDC101118 TaxID=3366109 RepID=UPI0038275E78
MAILRARKPLLIALAALTVAAATLGVANADSPDGPASAAPTSSMPPLVEKFNYPGAERLKEESGITLKRGDGHITLVECGGTPDITILARGQKTFCFDVNAKPAYLSMELADAFGIDTKDYPVKATITANGKTSEVNAPANDFTAYGESDPSGGTRSTLIELRVVS